MSPFVSKTDTKQMVRVLTIGCPHGLDLEMPHEERLKMIKQGNASLVTDHFDIVRATLNKEERYLHVVPALSWLCPIPTFSNAISQARMYNLKIVTSSGMGLPSLNPKILMW